MGVILDDKLTWKEHMRAQVKKGLRVLRLCNAFIGRVWGLEPKMTLLLYKRVIIPKITYVAVAWWDIMDIPLERSKLERLQRANENNSNISGCSCICQHLKWRGVCSADGSIGPTKAKALE